MADTALSQQHRTSIADYLPLMAELYASFSRITLEEWVWINHMRGITRDYLQPEEIAALEMLYEKYRADVVWREENQDETH